MPGLGNPNWVPGHTSGRPKGSPNKKNEELQSRLKARGDKDPADFLSEVVTNDKEPKELRVQAANMLLPYFYNKKGTIAPPPIPLFLEQQVTLQRPATTAQARDNIAYLTELKATGQIDQAWGDNLIADQYKILSALVDEAKIAIQGGEQGEQVIRIEGGLPVMPGLEELIMPKINGHQHDELPAIEHGLQAPSDSVPTDKEPGP
jgi:hypothetical protein